MSEIVLYIAKSLDGFIARPNGDLDWLTSIPMPTTGDYGYAELLESVETILMGRNTYEEIIKFGIEWPYSTQKTYVVTSNNNFKLQSPNTFLLTEDFKNFIEKLKIDSTKNTWLVGGSKVITAFINDNLIDKMIISIIPKIIGEGIPLFAFKPKETEWKLIDSKSFDTGVVNLTYQKNS